MTRLPSAGRALRPELIVPRTANPRERSDYAMSSVITLGGSSDGSDETR